MNVKTTTYDTIIDVYDTQKTTVETSKHNMDTLTTIANQNFIAYSKHVERMMDAYNEGGISLSIKDDNDDEGMTDVQRLFRSAQIMRDLVDDTLKIEHEVEEPEILKRDKFEEKTPEEREEELGLIIRAAINDLNLIGGVLYVDVSKKWSTDDYNYEKRLAVTSALEAINPMLARLAV